MTSITRYRCDICKRDFDNITDAEKCENEHLTIEETRIKRFGIYPHPYELEITFSNGDKVIYTADYLRG